MSHEILCDEQPLTNSERLELWRRKRWCLWLDEPEQGRNRPVLWEHLRLCWGMYPQPPRQAE